jgi:hypothetical protein
VTSGECCSRSAPGDGRVASLARRHPRLWTRIAIAVLAPRLLLRDSVIPMQLRPAHHELRRVLGRVLADAFEHAVLAIEPRAGDDLPPIKAEGGKELGAALLQAGIVADRSAEGDLHRTAEATVSQVGQQQRPLLALAELEARRAAPAAAVHEHQGGVHLFRRRRVVAGEEPVDHVVLAFVRLGRGGRRVSRRGARATSVRRRRRDAVAQRHRASILTPGVDEIVARRRHVLRSVVGIILGS